MAALDFRGFQDDDLLGIFMQLCSERPSLQARILEALTGGEGNPFEQRFVGLVKKFDPAKRFGFIECAEVSQQFGRDPFLSDMQIGLFTNGSQVSFRLTVSKDGKPQAQDLEPVAVPAAPAAQHRGQRRKLEEYGQPQMPMMQTQHGRNLGTIKKFDFEKKFGFIECPELHAVYGRDVFVSDMQIGSFTVGTSVSFVMTIGKTGAPQAQDLQPAMQARGQFNPPQQQARGQFNPPAVQQQQRSPQAGAAAKRPRLDPGALHEQPWLDPGASVAPGRYVGMVKKFDAAKHFGFIDCPQVQVMYGADCFLSDKQIGAFDNGDVVSFSFYDKNGKPQAFDLGPAH